MFKNALILLAISFSLAGCEATDLTLDPGHSNPAFPPVDDRADHTQIHRTDPIPPVWPADVDTGGGSGTR